MVRKHVTGPFVLPVRDLVHRPGEMREHSFEVPSPAKWGEGVVAVAEREPIGVDVRLESVHEGILASGTVDTEYTGVCSRCLTDITEGFEVEFQELFAYPGEDETDFEVQDDHVDLETLVREAVVLSLPFQPVCQPDCPGLDPVTGERLTRNAGSEQSAALDPRWAALQEFTSDVPRSRGADQTEES